MMAKTALGLLYTNHTLPQNNLGAIEAEGRVYFIINNFPVNSGIRIPPGEVYPVSLDGWENLGKVAINAVLCHVPVKRSDSPYKG